MKAFYLGLLTGALLALTSTILPSQAHADTLSDPRVINCTNGTEHYFIRPAGILYVIQGVANDASCMVVRDTEGKQHTLYHAADSKDVCEMSEVVDL